MPRRPLLLICTLLTLGPVLGAQEPKPDPFQIASQAAALGRHEHAIRTLKEFVAGSVGDPRLGAARKQIAQSSRALAEQLIREGREDDAARQLVALANDKQAEGVDRDATLKEASAALNQAIEAARKRNEPFKALRLAAAYRELFPRETPALSDADRQDLSIRTVRMHLNQPAAIEHLPSLNALCFAGRVPWDQLNTPQVPNPSEAYLKALSARGWAGKIIYETSAGRLKPDAFASPAMIDLLDSAYVARLQAWLAVGNVREVTAALKAAEAGLKGKRFTSRLNSMQRQAARAAPEFASPKPLKFDQNISGNGQWLDPGHGYDIQGTVRIGGDKAGRAAISVAPGTVLNGGRIEVEEGSLTFAGTPERPIVVRNVQFGCELGGTIVANCTVFENCTFRKTGGWFSTYSSKWRFSNSLIYRSHFPALTKIDYGVQFEACTFVETTLPARVIPPGDLAREFNDQWNTVRACHFVQCPTTPSFTWMTKDCSFFACPVQGQSTFESTTDLSVRLHALFPDQFLRDLVRGAVPAGRGAVTYVNAPTPLPGGCPPSLWALLPV